ncbi:MAG: hypothetical protein ACYCW6_30880 [Candidatus Xenobia bacterium]
MTVDGLKARGIKDDKVLQSVVGTLETTAVLAPMLQTLLGGWGK